MNPIIPQHIAIIMDGNGRWAENKGLARYEGHKAGIASIRMAVESCLNAGVPMLTLFAFSRENWHRPPEEVTFLMDLFFDTLGFELQILHEKKIRMVFIGAREGLPDILRTLIDTAEEMTRHNTALTLCFAINYSGRWDLEQAFRTVARKVQQGSVLVDEINEGLITNHLVTASMPEPDLLIRTSGEWRLSNFFLWQTAYTELYFTSALWPDFDVHAFQKALQSFQRRQRRFGRTGTQIKEQNHERI